MATAFCSACGDVLGVYEPVVAVFTGHARITSLLNEPGLIDDGARVYHAACHPPLKLAPAASERPAYVRPDPDA